MHKRYSLFLLLFLAVSCGQGGKGNEEVSPALTDTTPISVEDPVPPEALSFEINIKYINFTDEQKLKYEQAVEIVKQVVASEDFKTAVLIHSYNGQTTYVDNDGQSNSTIYRHILDANETLQPLRNNAIDMEVELYYENSTVIGYTYPNTTRIWVNTKYFDTNTPSYVAGNLFHEWLHKLGYIHAVSYSISRDYSVPYAIGNIIRSLGKQYDLGVP